jgi:hypothetical protein
MRPSIGRSSVASSFTMTSIASAIARILVASTRTECSATAATDSTCLMYCGGVNAGIELVEQRRFVRRTTTVRVARASTIAGGIGIAMSGIRIGAITVVGAGVVVVLSTKHADCLDDGLTLRMLACLLRCL